MCVQVKRNQEPAWGLAATQGQRKQGRQPLTMASGHAYAGETGPAASDGQRSTPAGETWPAAIHGLDKGGQQPHTTTDSTRA